MRQKGAGMGNVRQKRRKQLPQRKLEIIQETSTIIDSNEKHIETKPKGIGILVKPASNEIQSSFLQKEEKSIKRKLAPSNKLNSIVGRSAFKPSLILTADQPKSAPNKKRIKKDIFGIY
jgi:hypothetical protein